MIILCCHLVLSIRARLHPMKEFTKPFLHSLLIILLPVFRTLQQSNGIDYFNEVPCVDESCAATGVVPLYCLCEIQIRIHACGGIEKPCPDQSSGMFRVMILFCEIIRKREGVYHMSELGHVYLIFVFLHFG